MSQARSAKPITGKQVARGVALGIGLYAPLALLLFLLGILSALVEHDVYFYFVLAIFNPGATQLLYQIPACIILMRRGERGMALGIVIASSLMVLLNAGCWMYVSQSK